MSPPPVSTAQRTALDRIEALLTDLVAALDPDPGTGRGRPRILPATLLWTGLLVCVLRGWTSQRALWRRLTATGLWHFTPVVVSDQAVYKRLGAVAPSPMATLFTELTAVLVERLAPYADRTLAPHAAEVYAIDQTTLDPVARRLPLLREAAAGDAALLPGQLAGVFDVRRQLWQRVDYIADPLQNEKIAARALIADLPRHSLLLFDLGYFAFPWFDELTAAGYWWISRLRDKTSTAPLHTAYADEVLTDEVVWLGAHRANRARFAVRRITVQRGTTRHQYITNVLNPTRLGPAEIVALYARRWDIELAVNTVKTELGLHLLWSGKPAVILHQVWAVLLIAQMLSALRVLIAAAAALDPFDVSLPLLIRYLPQYAARHPDPIAAFVADGWRLGYFRPARRIRVEVPAVSPAVYRPPPPGLRLVRSPRYDGRRCQHRR